jgi:hypothetical protein
MATLGDERQIASRPRDLLAEEVAGDRWVVVDEEATFAVEEFAAGGEDGDFADAVGFGERSEVLRVEHLKAPEADEQNCENERDEVLD